MPSSENASSRELVLKRAVLALVLFKPFRTLEELIGVSDGTQDDAWMSTYEVWKDTRSEFVVMIMDNMQDYYRGARMVEEHSRAAAEAVPDNLQAA
jgi:hypothetical protein